MEESDYDEDPIVLNNQIKRLSVQLLKCQMRRRKSTGSALQYGLNNHIGIEDMLVISDVPKNTTTDSWFGALLKNAWATINAVLCGGFIAIECASVLVGIIFFHIWFITPYNVICAMLDLKRRCLVALYNIILSRCMKPISQLARVAAYILWGKQYDNI